MGTPGYYNVYIDEAGDEGFRNLGQRANGTGDASSEWLVMTGVIIHAELDQERTRAVDRLRVALDKTQSRKPLHWRDLRAHHGKKRRAMDLLAREPLRFCSVAMWKPPIPQRSAALQRPGYLYNYATRFLIERLGWFAGPSRRKLNLLFESRASTRYDDLERYVRDIEARSRYISRGCVACVKPVNASRKGVQLADFYAGATFAALEPDDHGYTTVDYIHSVRRQLFRRSGRAIHDDGFKVFPRDALDDPRYRWIRDL